jgi:hypothetical protein
MRQVLSWRGSVVVRPVRTADNQIDIVSVGYREIIWRCRYSAIIRAVKDECIVYVGIDLTSPSLTGPYIICGTGNAVREALIIIACVEG